MKFSPIGLIKKSIQTIRLQRAALDEWNALEAAQADPSLYRNPSWWSRVLTAAHTILDLLPLPESGRHQVSDFLKKAGMLVGAGTVIVGALVDPQVLAVLPPKVGGAILSVAAILGVISGYLHPAPPKSS